MNKSSANFKPKSNIPGFLLKTYDILDNTTHSDIISWNKEGTAFIVYNINEFAEKILPKYFKHNNFSSFVRQLNMYDFHKSKQDGKENEFKHKLFRKGQKHLLADIKRKGAENNVYMEDPMMNGEANKIKKNTSAFNDELNSVKIQQEELGRVGKMIYSQNSQLLNENKLLWNELTKNKDKYEKKIEKLMMFVYSAMDPNRKEALAALPEQKTLPFSESTAALQSILSSQETPDTSPNSQQKENFFFNKKESSPSSQDRKSEEQFNVPADQPEAKLRSPHTLTTPSNVSTVPNTPNMGPMVAPPNLFSFGTTQPMYPIGVTSAHNIYNAQPYLTENNSLSPKENAKLARPAPNMDAADAKEFKENPSKIFKKDNEGYMSAQNPLQAWKLPSYSGMTDSFKLDEYPVPLNLSRGPSFNGGDLSFSRFNSYRIPTSLEANFAQWPMYIQNLQSNGETYGLNMNKLESEGMPMLNEDGLPCFSPGAFIRTPNGIGAFTFGQACEDPLYRNKH